MSHKVLALRTLQGYYRGEQEASPLRKQGISGVCIYRQGMVVRRGAAAVDWATGGNAPSFIDTR